VSTKVGFIGLGIMGAPMAINLQHAGFSVTGYNRTPEKARRLAAAGGRAASSVAEAVDGADVVALMLPDSPDVLSVVTGEGGVLDCISGEAVIIDFSTISPDTAAEVARAAASRGVTMLDAPVSGGEQGAIDGTLAIMVGGDAATIERVRPVLDAVGTTIVHVGPSGSGQTVKAANQLIVAGNIQLVAEAIVLLTKRGVDPRAGLEVIKSGLAGSTVLARKGDSMLAHQFAPGFRLQLHSKDLGIALASAREVGAVLPLTSAVAQLVTAMVARGDGGLDHSALLRLVENLSGMDDERV
jgi:2-hydroxy-3-oxopropionate reductase